MKTAVISYIDDNVRDNFENDFLPTLRKDANYNGEVFLIYYGSDGNFARRIEEKFKVKIFYTQKTFMASNQRNMDLPGIIDSLPEQITNVMCIDGGDVWFQSPIDEIFELTKNGYGFVEENAFVNEGFNLGCINQIEKKELRRIFLKNAKNFKLVNNGMIVGERKKVSEILRKAADLFVEVGQDIFGLDQTTYNYIVRNDGCGIVLPETYNFFLLIRKDEFLTKNKIFYNRNNALMKIIHNLGNRNRLLPEGRKSLEIIPKIPEKLAGTFWGITAFFNPAGYKNKIKNYRTFRKKSKKQGLKLLAVELVFGNKKFELNKKDAEILIQLRTSRDNIMWQKERLINIGIENLPKDCDKFVWLDADIIFLNDDWIKETSVLLERYAIVQPFSFSIRLSREKAEKLNELSVNFFENIRASQWLDKEGEKNFSAGYKISQIGRCLLQREVCFYGQVGLAWAARKKIFEKDGILDKSALTNLDLFMAHLFYSNKLNWECESFSNKAMRESFLEWKKNINNKINGSVYYTNGGLLHLWHGIMEKRNYGQVIKIINEESFDPKKDIRVSKNGCFEWASNKPELHKKVREYFFSRAEDGFFEKKFSFFDFVFLFSGAIKKIPIKIDMFLGKVGIIIKKISPSYYFKLKKIERKFRNYLLKRKIEKILKENWVDYKKDIYPKDRRMKVIKEKNVLGLNTENVRFFINEVVRKIARNGIYLEVGTFQGGSLLSAALFNNSTRCIGIDNFSEIDYGENEKILMENISKFDAKNIYFLKMDGREAIENIFAKEPNLRISVYFYDGNHSYESQLNGLRMVLPFLARECIIIVDDLNWEQVEMSNKAFLKENPNFSSLFKIRTKGDKSEDWWNGIEILGRGF